MKRPLKYRNVVALLAEMINDWRLSVVLDCARPSRQHPGSHRGSDHAQERTSLCRSAGLCLPASQGLWLLWQVGILLTACYYYSASKLTLTLLSHRGQETPQEMTYLNVT